MKNNLFLSFLIIFFNFFILKANAIEQFNFDVTEINIIENGRKFIGTNRGIITSNDGVVIEADKFIYNKDTNILNANGNVKLIDNVNNYSIYTDSITYKKKENLVFTKKNSKAESKIDNTIILAEDFKYDRKQNIITAEKNVIVENKLENYKIKTNFLSYLLNQNTIYTKGTTEGSINLKYFFTSEDIIFSKDTMEIISKKNTTFKDKSNIYKLSNFVYFLNDEKLKGEKILIKSNYKLPKSDEFFFQSAIIDLKNQNFLAKDIEINIHKEIFNNPKNDPRVKGVSSKKTGDMTIINKGVFTSCKKNDKCPPWSIAASEIKHDKSKKQLIYKDALLKIYDFPILYFPKFFHPDPTVQRQSGLLQPRLNNSNVLGSSISIPYYHVLSNDSDLTVTPTIFDKDHTMIQNEYRKIFKNSNLKANVGHVRNYKSSDGNKKKNISHLFSEYDHDLNLGNFISSNLKIAFQKTTSDTYLKIFDNNIANSDLKPNNLDVLKSEIKIELDHEDYFFESGIESYESLNKANSDRYQYILPYYNFDKILSQNYFNGSISINSSGSNDLNETNVLKTKNINDLSYQGFDIINKFGFKNNFNIYVKNLNSIGKNDSKLKSSPQVELMSALKIDSSLPLIKKSNQYQNNFTPKLSFMLNPSDMKNNSTTKRVINNDNIFNNNRLGLTDSLETGKSLTIGFDYKKQQLNNINKYFQFKLATVLRDKEEPFIPNSTTLNKKNSNLFGSISNNFSDHLNLKYKFAIDNNFEVFEYNEFNSSLSINNLITEFAFIEEGGEMGSTNSFENNTKYKFDDHNSISFKTRRNRKINLTEYYDLVYEYQNDCLTAGIKYKKTYYEDRDLKPTENLLFTITLFPLTSYEQKLN